MERLPRRRSRLDLVAFLICFLVAAGALLFASAVALSYIGRDGDPDPVEFDAERWQELPPSKEKHAMALWLVEEGTLAGSLRMRLQDCSAPERTKATIPASSATRSGIGQAAIGDFA